jgi:hypothetical protein
MYMKNFNTKKFAGALLLSAMGLSAFAQNTPCGQNLIANGDFEAGNTGFSSGYTFKTNLPGVNNEMIPENTYGVDANINGYHPSMTGVGRSGNYLMVNGNTSTIKNVWSTSVFVMAGKQYEFTAWVQNIYPTSPAVLRFVAGGTLVGTHSATGNATWSQFTGTYVATTTGNIDLTIIDANLTAFGNDFGIDDISFVENCPVTPPGGGCYASEVMIYAPGLNANGQSVRPERSISSNALGAPNGQTPTVVADVQNFVSLGYGGYIELAFEQPIANGPGADIRIWESSVGVNNEAASILVSQDGLGYVPVGNITQDGEVDFGAAYSDYVQYIRIVDATSPASSGQYNDGFDVDAVECLHGAYEIPVPPSCSAVEVISFNQGPASDLISPVSPDRSIQSRALGTPENSDATTLPANNNFLTLGFGGEIVLKFGSPIKNGAGDDIFVVETTFGSTTVNNCSRYPERIRAYAGQDTCHWVYLGEGCQDTYFDLQGLAWAQYVKLVDVSPAGNFLNGGDAYDLDGILCLNGSEENPVPAAITDGASEVVNYSPGLRRNGTPIPAARANANNALGAPQNSDVINFVALGFGGSLTLKFPYVVFDNPAANDLQVVETTYGNASCAGYPEKAEFEGSLDGVTWVNLGVLCLDGELDIAPAGAIQYLRITDRSPASSFGGSADGYDVDGVVVINQSCGSPVARIADNNSIANEVTGVEVFPNPFNATTTVVLTTGDQDNTVSINVTNYLGQVVHADKLNVAASSTINHTLNLSDLNAGVYFVAVESNSGREVVRVVKH